MNKKKVDSILKGITAAGIAMGGVSSIQGADMVMAAIDESAADSNSLVDAGSLSESERTEYSESTTQSMSESASESTSESVKQSDAVQGSESVNENDGYVTAEEPADNDISVASFVSDVTYASAKDGSVGNSNYKSLEEVIDANIKDSSKTVYELGKDKVLVQNGDGSGVVYYETDKGEIKKLAIDAKAITENQDGSVTVQFDGYYINSDGTWKNTTYTDYNKKSGNKVFINNNFVVEDGNYWKEVRVNIKGKSYPVEFVGKRSAVHDSYVLIKVNGELYFLDGAHVENGKFYAAKWDYWFPVTAKKDVKLIGNVSYNNSYKKILDATSNRDTLKALYPLVLTFAMLLAIVSLLTAAAFNPRFIKSYVFKLLDN